MLGYSCNRAGDIVIFICDATEGLVDQDLKILNIIYGKPVLFVFNKIDL